MTEPIQFKVRFDPRPVIHDRRALITYSDLPDPREMHNRMLQTVAQRLGIPARLIGVADSNYSSARLEASLHCNRLARDRRVRIQNGILPTGSDCTDPATGNEGHQAGRGAHETTNFV